MASASLTTVASKQAALKERAAADKAAAAEIDRLVRAHVEGAADVPTGCFARFVHCPGMMMGGMGGMGGMLLRKRMPVSTVEVADVALSAKSAAPSAAASSCSPCSSSSLLASSSSLAAAASGLAAGSGTAAAASAHQHHRRDLATRLFGKSKKGAAASEGVRIETAMGSVQVRIEQLQDRLQVGKQRALALKRASRHEEALREMKKVKAVEKQLCVANAAMEALERQEAMLAESNLQRELAAALSSTNAEMKQKHKGLLSFAEKAVDESVELADDAQDIGAVFEGLVGASDAGVDDDELLEELNAMMEEDAGASSGGGVAASAASAASACGSAPVCHFPSAPQTEVVSAAAGGEKRALLSGSVA